MLKTLFIGLLSIISCVITAVADPLPPTTSHLRFDDSMFAAAPMMVSLATDDDRAAADATPAARPVHTSVSDVATWNGTKPCVPVSL